MRVLVTGGAGFIGANLVRRLLSHSVDVVVLDDLSTGSAANLEDTGAELVVGSVTDGTLVRNLLAGVHGVVHLAAIPSVPRSLEEPLATHHANATGTLTLLDAVRNTGNVQVILASSSSVYGDTAELPKREDMLPQPLSPYAVSKLTTEAYALAYARCFGTPVMAFRFFNVYGPYQPADHAYAAVVPQLVAAAVSRRTFQIFGDGEQTRDFTHVDSACQAIEQSLWDRVTCDHPVNLAFGSRTSVNGLVAHVHDLLGTEISVEHAPPRPGDVRDSQGDNTLLARLVPGVSPVPLAEGLRTVVTWMQATVGSH